MSHLDEGTLHALLDGELDLAEASEVQMHLGSCSACGSRLQEVKQYLAEADRLVGSLETPGAAGKAKRTPPLTREPRKSPPLVAAYHEPDPWEAPVILLPDAPDPAARRQRWARAFGWAAVIAVAVGGGRFLLHTISPGSRLPRDLTIASSPAESQAYASKKEISPPPEPEAVAPPKPARATNQNRAVPAKTSAEPKDEPAEALVDTAAEPSDSVNSVMGKAADSVAAEPETLAAAGVLPDSASSPDSAAPDTAVELAARRDTFRQNDSLDTRHAAAEALAELDRDRRRERAAAATAALPRPTLTNTEVAPAAEAPPPPRTPEQRAQIYLRIGLDEAAKQLGGPAHVIEGMTPNFIGLVNGRLVPGADPNRPVVRVVYTDSRGRLILLDQQRMLPGQASATTEGSFRWAVGDVMLYLRGEPGPETLRNLQRRVR